MGNKRVRLTRRMVKGEAGDFYEMNQNRTWEPQRSFDYVEKGNPDWMKWERPEETPELGPKEPRDDMGFGEFKEDTFKDSYGFGKKKEVGEAGYNPSKQASMDKAAIVALISKGTKVMKIATSLLPNLDMNKAEELSKVEGLATVLLSATDDVINDAYQNISAAEAPEAPAAEAAVAEPAEAPAVEEPKPEATVVEAANEAGDVTFATETQEQAEASGTPVASDEELYRKFFENDSSTPVPVVTTFPEAVAAANTKTASTKPPKKGISKLPAGPRESSSTGLNPKHISGIWTFGTSRG